jgi:hypothetical protein
MNLKSDEGVIGILESAKKIADYRLKGVLAERKR